MLKHIFKTATFKQSQITITGSIINGGLGALFYVILARFLGPSDFGILTISVAVLVLIVDVADFGTNTGLVRHVSSFLVSDKTKAIKFLKLSLEIKFLAWIFVLVFGVFFSPLIAAGIFNKPQLTDSLRLVMVGVGGVLLFSFATSSLQAYQQYVIWSAINVVTNLLRVVMVIVLLFFGTLTLQSGLISYILLPFVGFSLALLFLPFKEILHSKNEFGVARELFKFNILVAAFTIIAAVSARLDTFLTARFLTIEELGIYGAATQLTLVVPQIITALGAVAAPKFASFVSNKDMLIYLKKFQLFILGLCLLGILTIPFVVILIPIIFGSDYAGVSLPFVILFSAMLVFLFSIPIHSTIIYYFGKPDVFIWVSAGHLLMIGILGYFLIPNFGVAGAASTVLLGMVFNFVAPFIWLIQKLESSDGKKEGS